MAADPTESRSPGDPSGAGPQRADWRLIPHPNRFDLTRADGPACLAAHAHALERGDAGYLDPTTGLFVLTADHLAARPCCERGCRHCPWVV